jgi:hypothetical protein
MLYVLILLLMNPAYLLYIYDEDIILPPNYEYVKCVHYAWCHDFKNYRSPMHFRKGCRILRSTKYGFALFSLWIADFVCLCPKIQKVTSQREKYFLGQYGWQNIRSFILISRQQENKKMHRKKIIKKICSPKNAKTREKPFFGSKFSPVQFFWKIPSDLKSASPSGLFLHPYQPISWKFLSFFQGTFSTFIKESAMNIIKIRGNIQY